MPKPSEKRTQNDSSQQQIEYAPKRLNMSSYLFEQSDILTVTLKMKKK